MSIITLYFKDAQRLVQKGSFQTKDVTVQVSWAPQQYETTVEISDIPSDVEEKNLLWILQKKVAGADVINVGSIADGKAIVTMKTADGLYY